MNGVFTRAAEALIIVIKVYYDSSGTYHDPAQKLVSLAGIVSSENHWAEFEKGWRGILKHHGAEYFHCVEARNLRGGFSQIKGWDDNKVDALFADLMDVVSQFRDGLNMWGQVCIIGKNAYDLFRQSVPGIVPIESVCVGNCIGRVLAMSDQKPSCIELFFDQNESFAKHINEYWKASKDNSNHIMRWIGHIEPNADMRALPSLQLADILAWLTNRQHNENDERVWYENLERALSFDPYLFLGEFELKHLYHLV